MEPVKRVGIFLAILWVTILLILVWFPEARPAEPEEQQEVELTITDKAKIAGGCFLACLMNGSPSYEERYVEEIRVIGKDEIVHKETTIRRRD